MRDARHVVVDMSDEGVDHDDEGGDYDASSITTPSDQIYKCVGDPSGSTSPP